MAVDLAAIKTILYKIVAADLERKARTGRYGIPWNTANVAVGTLDRPAVLVPREEEPTCTCGRPDGECVCLLPPGDLAPEQVARYIEGPITRARA